MAQTIQAVRGMNDVLPDQAPLWEFFEDTVRGWLAQYGYRNIRMPILEKTELFVRSIGEVTDIVEKEMYTFVDQLNGESLTLRPEGTASCVRAVIEHNLLYNGAQRVFYIGPMFRHERPQKGRYRQFHQVGVEALGFSGPDVDVEHMVMGASLWKRLRLDGLIEQIGGKPAPACGFAMGVERLLALLGDSGIAVPARAMDAYLVHSGESASRFAWNVAESLRGRGVSVVLHCGGGSFKSQMKRADASGARYAGIMGDEEEGGRGVSFQAHAGGRGQK